MSTALHIKTTILPGGKLEVVDVQFPAGQSVDVVVIFPDEHAPSPRPSAVDILRAAPGQRLFQTAADVEHYLHDERTAWGS